MYSPFAIKMQSDGLYIIARAHGPVVPYHFFFRGIFGKARDGSIRPGIDLPYFLPDGVAARLTR